MSALHLPLPLDILDEVVQLLFLDGDKNVKQTLSACAAAGDRALAARVQRLLFTDIRLKTMEDFRTLYSLFSSNPSLATYIRILRIPHTNVEEVQTHISELISILGAVSNLQHFQLSFQDWPNFQLLPESLKNALLERFQTISSLVLGGIILPPLREIAQYPGLQALHIHNSPQIRLPTSSSDACESDYLDPRLRRQILLPAAFIPHNQHLEHICCESTSDSSLKPLLQSSKNLKTLNCRDLRCGPDPALADPFNFDIPALQTLAITAVYDGEPHRHTSIHWLFLTIASLLEHGGPTLTGSSLVVPVRALRSVSLTFLDMAIEYRTTAEALTRIDAALADVDKYPEFVEFGVHVITDRQIDWEEGTESTPLRSFWFDSMPRLVARGQVLIKTISIPPSSNDD